MPRNLHLPGTDHSQLQMDSEAEKLALFLLGKTLRCTLSSGALHRIRQDESLVETTQFLDFYILAT